ncbi:hypothetical protein NDU88_004712 [Pleurodeles waltl]|uniref:Uncharacterized protein n=1 Tax=Pleurodeles waltl TaxID=8319 RepID=A0AAV7SJQ0_PLEWA|nr:hypothetical protein NDU88_004712 [Pleurodeles waltl]
MKTRAPGDVRGVAPGTGYTGAKRLLKSTCVGCTPQDRGENTCFRCSQGNEDAQLGGRQEETALEHDTHAARAPLLERPPQGEGARCAVRQKAGGRTCGCIDCTPPRDQIRPGAEPCMGTIL